MNRLAEIEVGEGYEHDDRDGFLDDLQLIPGEPSEADPVRGDLKNSTRRTR